MTGGAGDQLRARKQRLDRLRPLNPKSLEALAAWYDVELTYTSNAIEGNTLTRSETAIVLEKGITIGGKPLKDHLEALGHRDALHLVRALAASDETVREIDIREIHRLIQTRVDSEEAGRYSRHQRVIAGSPLVLPTPVEIPALMGDFVAWLAAAPARPRDRLPGARPARRDPSVQRRQRPYGPARDESGADAGRLSAGRHWSGAPCGLYRRAASLTAA